VLAKEHTVHADRRHQQHCRRGRKATVNRYTTRIVWSSRVKPC
jgi:hypothetical protein